MRITGGTLKGQRLTAPRTDSIRPSSDRLREALFSIIGQELRGMKVLDLFAGTGCLGLEALSRGASRAVFVDIEKEALRLIKANIAHCGVEDRSLVIRKDLKKGIPAGHFPAGDVFDLVFLDPPYGRGLAALIMADIGESGLLSEEARIIAETSRAETLPGAFGSLTRQDSRQYGAAKISLYGARVQGTQKEKQRRRI